MKKKCEYTGPRLSAYLDGELSERDQQEVINHIGTCQICQEVVHELKETGSILKHSLTPASESKVDLAGVWEEIEARTHFGPTVGQRIKELFGKPVVWLPASAATAAVALLILALTIPKMRAPVEVSRVESVYSRTGQVMVLQTPKSGRPLIWILPGARKEVSS